MTCAPSPKSIETRAPEIIRENRSRPSWSVPSGKSREGASLRRPKLVFVYGSGASRSAKIATRQSRTITTPPAIARRFRRRRRKASRHRFDDRAVADLASSERGLCPPNPSREEASGRGRSPPPSLISDARVENAIEQVDDEVHDGEERAVGQDHGHDHRVVATRHGQDEEATHARHAKDRLDEERARPHRGQP